MRDGGAVGRPSRAYHGASHVRDPAPSPPTLAAGVEDVECTLVLAAPTAASKRSARRSKRDWQAGGRATLLWSFSCSTDLWASRRAAVVTATPSALHTVALEGTNLLLPPARLSARDDRERGMEARLPPPPPLPPPPTLPRRSAASSAPPSTACRYHLGVLGDDPTGRRPSLRRARAAAAAIGVDASSRSGRGADGWCAVARARPTLPTQSDLPFVLIASPPRVGRGAPSTWPIKSAPRLK